MHISVVGLGKLGAPLAAVLANAGHTVVGVDRDAHVVHLLATHQAPVPEPGLQALLEACAARLTTTTSTAEAIQATDVTLICVPTPSAASGLFDHEAVLAAVRQVGCALRDSASYHVVGIVSTVLPGTTDGDVRRVLEDAAERRVGDRLGLGYTPAFVALGSVVRDIRHPDLILVGESDPTAGALLERVYRSVCDKAPAVRRMAPVNAEIAKLAINTYVTTRISYANMLGELCEHVPGADVALVTEAIGLDTRIGAGYLTAAVGYGGPCFPRDNVALSALARRLGTSVDIAQATDQTNRHQVERLVAHVRAHATPGARVGILGLAYKPGTPVVDGSFGLVLARQLAGCGYRVRASDPLALDAARAALSASGGLEVELVSLEECAREVDVLIIVTPWPEYARLDVGLLERRGRRCVVIDCWRLLPNARFADVAELVYLGLGSSEPR